MKKWKWMLGLAGSALAIFVLGSWITALWLISPQPSTPIWPSSISYRPENITFPARDGTTLKGWFLASSSSQQTILLLHGVAANRTQMLSRALWFCGEGYNVLLYDARGCGESAKVNRSFSFSEVSDLLGALDWLHNHRQKEVICDGFSQGAATILLAAGKLPAFVRGIVAESPYATLAQSVDAHFRESTGLSSRWIGALVIPIDEYKLGFRIGAISPLNTIGKISCPILLMGGTSDTMVSPQAMKALFASAHAPKELWMVPWAGHGDFFSFAESEYKGRVTAFLNQCFESIAR